MNNRLESKRIFIFLAVAFGIAWAVALVIALTGGLTNSPQLAPNLTLALILMATFYMWAPAIAHVFTRWITREGWKNLGLRVNLKKGWRYYLFAWFFPAVGTFLGAVIFFLLFPQYFDPTLSSVREMLEANPQAGPVDPSMVVYSQLLFAVVLAPFINLLFAFGEEFGWRGYLLPKLLPLGGRKATLISGAIWGIWHWPVIFMGYEYGFEYFGAPVLGPVTFVYITFLLCVLYTWVTLRTSSVWSASLAHGAFNAIAGVGVFFVTGQPEPLLGPLPVGIIASLAIAIAAFMIFFRPGALETTPGQWPETMVATSVEMPPAGQSEVQIDGGMQNDHSASF